ncbi:hypothetical protein [Pedosphaera parvula]|uniref:Glycoside hydrolase family 42 N-terminal domain-containing protein n=1 Tax=Pedosphaera parvula (strain Ellin514) TaxID=320771 RepID=B9XF27_PEDPL|nr:hypothetical protein [Pedosphaera parvula]EEF61525.1 hypothetical protein Cflav_PD4203 [Pedosphaera parvula Ellin514]
MRLRWSHLFGITGCLIAFVLMPVAKGESASKVEYGNITKPDFFPILPWDPYHGWGRSLTENPPKTPTSGLESMAECHFNMAGFVLPKDLKLCQKLGLGAIMLPSDTAFTNFQYLCDWKKLSDQEIERRVKHMIDASGSSRAVMGYFIMDEPGAMDFPALAKAVAAVKKYAPGKFAYINLFPDYATLGATDTSQLGTASYHEYLERFVKEVKPQMISYDNYMVQDSNDLENRGLAASYYRNLLEIRRVAQEHQLPYLNIVSGNQIRPQTPIPSPANLSFQAYTTLAAGYRGVTWYTYYSRGYHYAPIDDAGKKTLTWAYLQEVNRQVAALAPVMSRLNSTGVFFSPPGPVDGLPLLPGGLVESANCATPLMIGEFQHQDGQHYIMVVNLNLKASAKFTLKLKHAEDCIGMVSSMDGSLAAFDQQNGLWLTAGQGVLLKLGK